MKPNAPWLNSMFGGNNNDPFVISDILSVEGSSAPGNNVNSVTVTLGVAPTGEIYTESALMFSPPGILSVPLPVGSTNTGSFVPSKISQFGAQAISYVRNDQHIILGTRDTRTQFTPGNLQPGETAVYATGSSACSLYKLDGSITHMTTATSDNASNVYFQVSPTAFTFMAPWGRMVFDATGLHFSTASGATFDMGGLNIPGPLAALGTYCNIGAGSIGLTGGTVMLGKSTSGIWNQVCYPLSPVLTPIPVQAGPVTTSPVTASPTVFVAGL